MRPSVSTPYVLPSIKEQKAFSIQYRHNVDDGWPYVPHERQPGIFCCCQFNNVVNGIAAQKYLIAPVAQLHLMNDRPINGRYIHKRIVL